ncbi:MAG TPA: hypothetical protein VLC98_03090 [Phnomibacter sp.]|nr:hypothetical protein [Phnomibacter sp.]
MKNLVVLTVALLVCAFNAQAKIWRVNNNNGLTADFTTLQAAHNGAVAGDTIHLESSATSYGSLTCTKKLIIIGTGYFLAENPNNQALTQPSYIDNISFNIGSEGSVVMGCTFANTSINVFASNIEIRRNRFTSPNGATVDYYVGVVNLYYQSNNSNLPVNNIIITQNFGLIINGTSRASTGILITNNYIARYGYEGDATANNSIDLNSGTVALIQNNIFRRGRINVYNSNLTNNIMVAGSMGGSGNLVSNNIGSGTQFGSTNGNKENIDMSTVFLGTAPDISPDGVWKLKAGSPAIGAGFGSTAGNVIDCGMFGGNFPYVLAGLPGIPSIYFFENQPVGSSSDPIDVNLKVKSNN